MTKPVGQARVRLVQLYVAVIPQADAIYDMIGFPEFILDPKELDDVYDGVSETGGGCTQVHIIGVV